MTNELVLLVMYVIVVFYIKCNTTIGEQSRITEVVEGCEIELEDHKLPLKLCSMNLKGFDVVLGMPCIHPCHSLFTLITNELVLLASLEEAYGEQAIDAMTWNGLKELVRSKFCPENELDKMETNFLKLEAGGMTHQEYTTKFDQMERVVPELVSTDERKVKRYLQGLPKVIRKQIKLLAPATYKRAVDLSATAYDEEYGEAGKPDGEKRKWSETSSSGKGGYKGSRKKTRFQGGQRNVCKKCNRPHSGECRVGTNVCFKCGK